MIGAEFGSSRDPCVLDARFRSMKSVVSQSRGFVSPYVIIIIVCKTNRKLKSKTGMARDPVLHRQKQNSRVLRLIWNTV